MCLSPPTTPALGRDDVYLFGSIASGDHRDSHGTPMNILPGIEIFYQTEYIVISSDP
jgi:hypothetical protein